MWAYDEVPLVAPGPTLTIGIRSTNPGNGGLFLDSFTLDELRGARGSRAGGAHSVEGERVGLGELLDWVWGHASEPASLLMLHSEANSTRECF